ncbi:type II toxin-antitoxin system RelE/ParE family toxin [Flavobacterium sp. UGB4466]|uniref:type II toxin-antitoxin system RelE/ParE family toxin n=1 Tax=Flavobacterium sp. UGB4466 TaxID=2730889 RepID=UPI00192B2CC1|nr:type II toxin-antitoxin system RelE/ParE family toxin [Flavobacterium sp. UGB4466]
MRQIIISDLAQSAIENLLEYLEVKWSERIRKKFATKLYQTVKIIQVNPEAFPISESNRKVHKCVVTKQSTLFYKFNNKRIEIIAFLDTRQDPNKIKKDIK